MIKKLNSGAVGFALGIIAAGVAAQAAQPTQHEHPTTPSTQAAPSHNMEQMHKMMADPAKHQEMMSRMAQCRDMMTTMMEHMKHEGMKKDKTPPQQ